MENTVPPACHALQLSRYPKNAATVPDKECRFRGGALRAVHVIAGLDPIYGGPSYSVPRLCEALAAAGAETLLLSVAGETAPNRDVDDRGYLDRRFPWDYARVPILRGLRSSRRLSRTLCDAALTANVIHDHGLWLMPNVRAGAAAARARVPLVISARGMLAPEALAFSRLKKRAFWRVLQGSVVRQAACIHATSEKEYQEIRAFGLINPITVIANGIDLPKLPPDSADWQEVNPVVLSLGRIHPIKRFDRLIQAWAKVEAGHPGWRLRIIGPSESGHAGELQALAAALGLTRVTFEGPVYGDAKYAAYRAASLFVLPTSSENFGLTVAEALATGIPAIATKGAPWRGLEAEGCGWCVDHGIEPLAAALAQAMALPREALRAMGKKGHEWMARDFSWDRVAHDMLDVYRWLAGNGESVRTVRFD